MHHFCYLVTLNIINIMLSKPLNPLSLLHFNNIQSCITFAPSPTLPIKLATCKKNTPPQLIQGPTAQYHRVNGTNERI